jgi:hypothetical protein
VSRVAIIERCGQCCHAHYSQSEGWVCIHSEPWKPLPAGHSRLVRNAATPDWCPLTPSAEVGRLRPLEWAVEHHLHVARAFNCALTVGQSVGGTWYWYAEDTRTEACESLEDGKAKAEAHYRVRMFGDAGPLVQIGGAK